MSRILKLPWPSLVAGLVLGVGFVWLTAAGAYLLAGGCGPERGTCTALRAAATSARAMSTFGFTMEAPVGTASRAIFSLQALGSLFGLASASALLLARARAAGERA